MKERVESKSTPKLDAVGEGNITMLSIRKWIETKVELESGTGSEGDI